MAGFFLPIEGETATRRQTQYGCHRQGKWTVHWADLRCDVMDGDSEYCPLDIGTFWRWPDNILALIVRARGWESGSRPVANLGSTGEIKLRAAP
jgi:hypothetical protein